jgi:hypothetical protein
MKQTNNKQSNGGAMRFVILLAIFALFYVSITNNNKQQVAVDNLKQDILNVQLSNKALIEANVSNLTIDSTFYDWQSRFWTTRDKFILDKMAKAASDKKRNLQQALEFVPDSAIFKQTLTTFEKKQDNKQQVSFSK